MSLLQDSIVARTTNGSAPNQTRPCRFVDLDCQYTRLAVPARSRAFAGGARIADGACRCRAEPAPARQVYLRLVWVLVAQELVEEGFDRVELGRVVVARPRLEQLLFEVLLSACLRAAREFRVPEQRDELAAHRLAIALALT